MSEVTVATAQLRSVLEGCPASTALDEVVLLAHLGGATLGTREAMGACAIANATAFLAGHTPTASAEAVQTDRADPRFGPRSGILGPADRFGGPSTGTHGERSTTLAA